MCLRQARQRGIVLHVWRLTENSLTVPAVLLFVDIARHGDVMLVTSALSLSTPGLMRIPPKVQQIVFHEDSRRDAQVSQVEAHCAPE